MPKNNWTSFPKAFWTANLVELFERTAFYGMYMSITLYLTDLVDFSDVESGYIVGTFAALLYLFPTFTGALADKWGFKFSLAGSFIVSAIGYGVLGLYPSQGSAIFALTMIMLGGSVVKPVISGTVAKCSSEANRARGYAIFYTIVNIGGFLGKTIAAPVRMELGVQYVSLYSAGMCVLGLIIVFITYDNPDTRGTGKSVTELWEGLKAVISNRLFMAAILIVSGFWVLQHQLYAVMPKYVLRCLDPDASMEWWANINPLTIFLLQMPITHLSLKLKLKPFHSIAIGLAIIPFSALVIVGASGFWVFAGGIVIVAFAEMFLSTRFLEYASKLAPPDQMGLYMGYTHLYSFVAKIVGFVAGGYLLKYYCPDPRIVVATHEFDVTTITDGLEKSMIPRKLSQYLMQEQPEVFAQHYGDANYIYLWLSIVGFIAFFAFLILMRVAKKKNLMVD